MTSRQSKVIDIFPKFKMAAAAVLDFQFMWIWPFRRVDSVVFVFCTWDRRTYASDLHLMTSRELLPVSTTGYVVIFASPWCIFPYNLMEDIFIQSKVIDIFPKFKMAAVAILDFQFMWIWPFRRVGSVVFVFCTKFGSNICYSHWDRRTYASDLYFMTSHEITSGFCFWSCGHYAWPWCIFPYNLVHIFVSSPELLTFFLNSRWPPPPPSCIFSLCEFGHSGVLIVWHSCSVPNLVQISVVIPEIDAHMLQTFSWWRHAN